MAFSKIRVNLDYEFLQDKLAELFAAKEPLRQINNSSFNIYGSSTLQLRDKRLVHSFLHAHLKPKLVTP